MTEQECPFEKLLSNRNFSYATMTQTEHHEIELNAELVQGGVDRCEYKAFLRNLSLNPRSEYTGRMYCDRCHVSFGFKATPINSTQKSE